MMRSAASGLQAPKLSVTADERRFSAEPAYGRSSWQLVARRVALRCSSGGSRGPTNCPRSAAALVALARRHGTTVDEVVTRELEDVACAHAEELEGMVPGMRAGLEWPERTTGA